MKKWIATVAVFAFIPIIAKGIIILIIESISVNSFYNSSDFLGVAMSLLFANIVTINYIDKELKEDKLNLTWTVVLLIIATMLLIFSTLPTGYIKDISIQGLKNISLALLIISTIYCGLTIYEVEKVQGGTKND